MVRTPGALAESVVSYYKPEIDSQLADYEIFRCFRDSICIYHELVKPRGV